MSENIQSISQGTYTIGASSTNDSSLLVTQNEGVVSILQTQQEVSHDNTLSGNGTVDSPLGVVPGYNETVLFDGTPTSVTSDVPLTENPANFEYVDVFAKWNYNSSQNIYCYNRIPTSAANFNMYGYGTYDNGSTTDFNLWMVVGDYTLTSNKISVLRAYRRTAAGDGGNNTDTLKIFKVIGVNRKA